MGLDHWSSVHGRLGSPLAGGVIYGATQFAGYPGTWSCDASTAFMLMPGAGADAAPHAERRGWPSSTVIRGPLLLYRARPLHALCWVKLPAQDILDWIRLHRGRQTGLALLMPTQDVEGRLGSLY